MIRGPVPSLTTPLATSLTSLITAVAMSLLPYAARADTGSKSERPWVGDPVNGKKLFARECGACHGDDGKGGRTGVSLGDSGALNLVPDDAMFGAIKNGDGLKKPKEHAFASKLGYLDIWDVVAHTRSLHMTLDAFFPGASRYVCKPYAIDTHGLDRLKQATGKELRDKSAAVFTFFTFEGEDGTLRYVPQDPIQLDQLKKNKKSGYLVFLPFETKGFSGELGIGMDGSGQITKLSVHAAAPGADVLNKSLAQFSGLGKKGQKDPFKVSGGKPMDELALDVFPLYLRAMETVTMYDREETERTWADE